MRTSITAGLIAVLLAAATEARAYNGPLWTDADRGPAAAFAKRYEQFTTESSHAWIAGIGQVMQPANDCVFSYYPIQNGQVPYLLSAYLLTGDERYRSAAERQLAYAHSLENDDHLLVAPVATRGDLSCTVDHPDPDPDSLTTALISRDSVARLIYGYYYAYRATANWMYLDWADATAESLLKLPRYSVGDPYAPQPASAFAPPALTNSERTFAYTYESSIPGQLWRGGSYSPVGSARIDTNQDAEISLALFMLYNDPASRLHGSPGVWEVLSQELRLAMALQIRQPDMISDHVQGCPTDASCHQVPRGAISVAQGNYYVLAFDEVYGAYTGQLVAAMKGLGYTGAGLSEFLQGTAEWLRPNAMRDVQLRYYDSRDKFPGPWLQPNIEAHDLWTKYAPLMYHGTSEAEFQEFMDRFLGPDPAFAGSRVRGNAAEAYSLLRVEGVPDHWYLPPGPPPIYQPWSSLGPPLETATVFLRRTLNRVDRLASYQGDKAHSQWIGGQEYENRVAAVASAGGEVYVALDLPDGGGRLICYDALASGDTMFNVLPDGITQLPDFSRRYRGHQDFAYPIRAVHFDGKNLWVALATAVHSSRLVKYLRGTTGGWMLGVDADGITRLPGHSTQYVGFQEYDVDITALTGDSDSLWVALSSQRLVRYRTDASVATMFNVAPDGITQLEGFFRYIIGYQQYDRPVAGVSLAPVAQPVRAHPEISDRPLWVALSATAGGRGTVIRYSWPTRGSGASIFYVGPTGKDCLQGWENSCAEVDLGWQDLDRSVEGVVATGDPATASRYVFVTTQGNALPGKAAEDPLRYVIKYFASPEAGPGLFQVQGDGVTPAAGSCAADPCSPIEYTHHPSQAWRPARTALQ